MQRGASGKSGITKLDVLGAVGVPCKRFGGLPTILLAERCKPVEVRGIAVECFFSHWLVLWAPDISTEVDL